MTHQLPQILEMSAITAGRSYTVGNFDRPGSGPTILYIHGLGCSKADFIEMSFIPELKPYRLISAPNPGCAYASCDEKHALNIDAVVELVENFVEEVRLSRFLLVGGSMGGLVRCSTRSTIRTKLPSL